LLHLAFPRYFRWKEETAGLSLMTRQVLHVHTFFIAFTPLWTWMTTLFVMTARA
jgi:hypothetical protein